MVNENHNPDTPDLAALDLNDYDWVLISSSAGKDSQAMLTTMVEKCAAAGVKRSRLVVVHADLGRVEWLGTKDLAERQAKHYGLRFEVVTRPQGDLLHQVEFQRNGLWPSSTNRYCTSDHKRGQILKLLTRLTNETRAAENTKRRIKILDCWGIRAEESTERAKKDELSINKKGTNKKRLTHTYLPVFNFTENEVWATIKRSGVEHHRAYDLGMPRLSCCFCIYSGRDSLLIAGEHNPELLEEYVALEKRVKFDFMYKKPLSEIQDALARGERGKKHMAALDHFDCSA